jgi:serine/threonine-protein kinase RsbW
MYRKLKIESKMNNLRLVEKVIDEITSEIGISQDSYGKILVSTLEGVNNAILHGNNCIPGKFVDIEIRYAFNELQVKIEDEGEGFKPEEVPDPTMPGNIEELNGRGVYIMKKLSDELMYNEKGNAVTMIFKNL